VIEISGYVDFNSDFFSIEVDDYVPLRFRSYDGVVGGGYCRVFGEKNSLFEFIFDSKNGVVRGATLTSFSKIHSIAGMGDVEVVFGLPVLSENIRRRFLPFEKLDFNIDFSVGFGGDFVEIDFGFICDSVFLLRFGSVEFFINKKNFISGMRFVELPASDLERIFIQRSI